MLKALSLVSLFFLGSCASLHSVSMTQIPKDRSKRVSARASRLIFLGFNFDNDFVDSLSQELGQKCQNGQVRGILTTKEVRNYFLLHRVIVEARGYCTR